MADSVEIMPGLDEIQNMKVTDLRKKLKAFGLPANGNKIELMERLQEACLSSKGLDSFESSQLNLDDSQISPDGSAAVEENDMLDPENCNYSLSLEYIGSSLEDDAVLNDSENKLNISSTSPAKPLKKRTVSKAAEKVTSEKKVILNRTNVTLSEFNIKPVSDPKPVTVNINSKSETESKKALSVKTMSSAERLAMRAKRFNISHAAVTTNSKSLNLRNSKQSILSSVPVAPDLDVLKKRAERFGQCVSTVMKQIEQKEKLLKRKCKFGASVSATSSLDELEKKRRRAERFGVS